MQGETSAATAGEIDGLVSGYRDRCNCDPRDRFIHRAELAEATWKDYETAFMRAFCRVVG